MEDTKPAKVSYAMLCHAYPLDAFEVVPLPVNKNCLQDGFGNDKGRKS